MKPRKRKIIYVDMDFTLCDYLSAHTRYRRERPDILYPQSIVGFFKGLKPIERAIDTYQWLDRQDAFDVYILTAPSVRNPHSYSEKRIWVEEYLGLEVAKKLIISPNKGLLKGDVLIDDNISGKGQEHFEGGLVHFGSEEFPDSPTVRAKFQTLLDHSTI